MRCFEERRTLRKTRPPDKLRHNPSIYDEPSEPPPNKTQDMACRQQRNYIPRARISSQFQLIGLGRGRRDDPFSNYLFLQW